MDIWKLHNSLNKPIQIFSIENQARFQKLSAKDRLCWLEAINILMWKSVGNKRMMNQPKKDR